MNTISRSYLNVQNRRKPNSEKMRKTQTAYFMVTLKNWWAWPQLDDLSIPAVTFIVLFSGWSFWLCLAKSLRKTVSKQVRATRREQQDPAYIHGGHWGYRHRAGHGKQKYLLFIKIVSLTFAIIIDHRVFSLNYHLNPIFHAITHWLWFSPGVSLMRLSW